MRDLTELFSTQSTFDSEHNCLVFQRSLPRELNFGGFARALVEIVPKAVESGNFTGSFYSEISRSDLESLESYIPPQFMNEYRFVLQDMLAVEASDCPRPPKLKVMQPGHYRGIDNTTYDLHHDVTSSPEIAEYGRILFHYNTPTMGFARNEDVVLRDELDASTYDKRSGILVAHFKPGAVSRHSFLQSPGISAPFVHKAEEISAEDFPRLQVGA